MSGSVNIQAYSYDVEKCAVVADGMVHFEDLQNSESTLAATSGEETISIHGYGLLSVSLNTNVNFDGWVTGRYAFDEVPVSSVLALLEKGSDPSGVQLDEEMKYQTVSGIFEFQSPSPAHEFVAQWKHSF
jgi:ferric-dicitrate binding protein FerR (iron transport regulator)